MYRFVQRLGLAVAMALSTHAGAAHAADYTFSWITAGEGSLTQAFGLNNRGDVVGSARLYPDGPSWHAALWRDGVHTDLGGLGSDPLDSGEARAINDAGQIAGWSTIEGWRERATMWDGDGIKVDLHAALSGLPMLGRPPPDPYSHAWAINESGQAVGQSAVTGRTLPVLWSDGGVTSLSWAASNPWQTGGNAINNLGQIAGTSGTPASGSAHAVLWTNDVAREIGNLGGRDSFAYGINDLGEVVGASELQGNTEMHATFWSGLSVIDLGTLGGLQSQANDINGASWIVGWAKTATGQSHATLWVDGVAVDLNSLLDPAVLAAGWTLVDATAINEDGWIVGNASREGLPLAFMLKPIAVPDVPAPLMMLSGCLAVAAAVSRCRQQSEVRRSLLARPCEGMG